MDSLNQEDRKEQVPLKEGSFCEVTQGINSPSWPSEGVNLAEP